MPFLRIFMKVCRSKSRNISSAVTMLGWLPRQQNSSYKAQRTRKEIPSYRKHWTEFKLEKEKEVTRQREDSSCQTQLAGATAEKTPTQFICFFPPKKYIANSGPYKIVDFSPFSLLEQKLRSGCLAAAVGSDKHAGWPLPACEILCSPCKLRSHPVQGGCSRHREDGGKKDFAGRSGVPWELQRSPWGVRVRVCTDTRVHTDSNASRSVPASHPHLGTYGPRCPWCQRLPAFRFSRSPSCSSSVWCVCRDRDSGYVWVQVSCAGRLEPRADRWWGCWWGLCQCVCTYPGKSRSHTASSCSWRLVVVFLLRAKWNGFVSFCLTGKFL